MEIIQPTPEQHCVIRTVKDRCRVCYTCVRDCPAKAIRISGGQAEVVAARDDDEAVREEMGDLLFAVVNVARHLGVDPESALRAAVAKFRRRFDLVDTLARERGIDLATSGLEVLDALWDEAKGQTSG